VPSDRKTAVPVGIGRPRVLALDVAGSACSVAVAAAADVLSMRSQPMLRGQAEALLPMVDAAMREAALPVKALDLVAVTVGPGSFTGIRVGLAAARGIAFAASLPLVGVTGFEAVAASLLSENDADSRLVLAALESRGAELYVQLFDRDRPLAAPAVLLPEALAERIAASCGDRPLRIVGDAAERAVSALAERPQTSIGVPPAVVLGVARAALLRWRRGEPAGRAEPFYLRPPGTSLPRAGAGSAPS
jgi:tRNA threonylcarbamoyladenosine biosynthesis protein TsaB